MLWRCQILLIVNWAETLGTVQTVLNCSVVYSFQVSKMYSTDLNCTVVKWANGRKWSTKLPNVETAVTGHGPLNYRPYWTMNIQLHSVTSSYFQLHPAISSYIPLLATECSITSRLAGSRARGQVEIRLKEWKLLKSRNMITDFLFKIWMPIFWGQ